MATAYTPAPWRVSEPPDALMVLRKDGIPVASLDYDGSGSGDADEETAEANARLIAATPSLLVGLQDVYMFLSTTNMDREHPVLRKLRDLINQATST